MTTYSAIATLPDELSAAGLGDALEALGPNGVGVFEIEDGSGRWEVGAYFLEKPDVVALELLAAAYGAAPFAVSAIEDVDWVAQVRRELTPVRAGRFIVHGGHDRERIPANALSLEIEAAMAFGTGHHGTTEGCLTLLDRLHKRGLRARRIADIGCGTGVLAMGAARLPQPGPGRVGAPRLIASDLDPVAVATARANLAANGLRGRVAVVHAPGFRDARIQAGGPYDLVLMNILARPLKRLAPDAARLAAPGGVVVLSGLLTRQASDVAGVFRAWGFAPFERIDLRGWTSLALRATR